MKRYHTETERIANEVFDRAMQESTLPHAKFYVNGKEWNPSAEEIAMFDRFEQSALAQHEGKPIRLIAPGLLGEPINKEPFHPASLPERSERWIASEEQQEDFWAGLPSHRMGLRRAPVDWWHVGGFLALFGLSVGISIAIVIGVRELWEAFK